MSTSVHDCISFLLLILNLEKEISSKKKKKEKEIYLVEEVSRILYLNNNLLPIIRGKLKDLQLYL